MRANPKPHAILVPFNNQAMLSQPAFWQLLLEPHMNHHDPSHLPASLAQKQCWFLPGVLKSLKGKTTLLHWPCGCVDDIQLEKIIIISPILLLFSKNQILFWCKVRRFHWSNATAFIFFRRDLAHLFQQPVTAKTYIALHKINLYLFYFGDLKFTRLPLVLLIWGLTKQEHLIDPILDAFYYFVHLYHVIFISLFSTLFFSLFLFFWT